MGLGAAPLRSARPGFFPKGLVSRRGLVSLYAEPKGLAGVGLRTSSSSGNGNGAAELEAPGGSGKDGLLAGDDEDGGAGNLKAEDLLSLGGWGL